MTNSSPPSTGALPQPASRHALGLLRFPDPRTHWVVVMVATLTAPITDHADLTRRLDALHAQVSITGARLSGERWVPGTVGAAKVTKGEPLGQPELDRPFDLTAEAPLRVVLGAEGLRLGLAGHHAAFDGLALLALLTALTGGPPPEPVSSPPAGPPGSKFALLQRLVHPADRIAPTSPPSTSDAYASEEIHVTGSSPTARLVQACAGAAAAHNRRLHARWAKVGVTVAKGGPAGVGNVASYRRVDAPTGADLVPIVVGALASPDEPAEQVKASRALRLLVPLVDRFSDSFLLSNLGRHDVPGVSRVDFFPVARGRSAVAFAAASVAGGASTLTVRARDLSPAAARSLLTDASARFATSGRTAGRPGRGAPPLTGAGFAPDVDPSGEGQPATPSV